VYLVRVSNPALVKGRMQLVQKSNGALLYQYSSSEPSFGRRLNISKLPEGDYAVIVKMGKETFRYPLAIGNTAQSPATSGPVASAMR
jgi:hypothetical protein